MPITKSAKKALLVSKRQKAENDLVRAKVKNALKGAKLAIANKGKDVADLISTAYRELDLAAKKHVIHKNRASRIKSRLVKAASKEDVIETKPVKKAAAKKPAAKKKASKK